MKIPENALIHRDKLTLYLLMRRPKNDKSRFLSRAGFTVENPDLLDRAIRQLISKNNAFPDGWNDYGTFFRVEGDLIGPKDTLSTVTVWIRLSKDNSFRFVTLKPARNE